MQLAYLSENELYLLEEGMPRTLSCGRVEQFERTRDSIRRRTEWKTSGAGARFMGTDAGADAYQYDACRLTGLSAEGDRLVYGFSGAGVGGIYFKAPQGSPEDEIMQITELDTGFRDLSLRGEELLCAITYPSGESHIAGFSPGKKGYTVFTDGDCTDRDPSFVGEQGDFLFVSSGFSRAEDGPILGQSPYAVMRYSAARQELVTLLEDERHSFFRPLAGRDGKLYCLRRPAEQPKAPGMTARDVLLAPVRLIRAVGNFLDTFSAAFSGEPLRSGNAKAAKKDPGKMMIDGNLINAEQIRKQNEKKGEKYPGFIPSGWELVRCDMDGENLQVLAGGVLDYTLSPQGEPILSNGSYILRLLPEGGKEKLCKAHTARNLCCW
ncbi:MAG: hypothetical protein E7486_01535 [Ruminococcaceae bacterium]|nr:hypothetical protein [Oscillospiraceae bacterium]